MPSLISRIVNAITNRTKHSANVNLGSLYPVMGQGRGRDLLHSEQGAAQSYAVMTSVQRGISVWENWLDGLEWRLHDQRTDKIIASSEDRVPPVGDGSRFFTAIKRFPKNTKHSFFKSVAFSDKLYGETYFILLENEGSQQFSILPEPVDLWWANPLAIEPQFQHGHISHYHYHPVGYSGGLLSIDDVIFRIAHRNPFEDFRGQSPVLSAMDEINIERNVKRALRGYYKNGMILGGVISPPPDVNRAFSKEQSAALLEQVQLKHNGVDNAHTWLHSPEAINVEQFQPIDIEKNYTIVEPLRNETMMALGVPLTLAGDPSQVNYDNADKVQRNWWQVEGIPYARDVAEDFINTQVLPILEPRTDIYFSFDLAPFKIEDPDTVATDVNAGYVSITTAQEKRGVVIDPDLSDIYLIGGRPMHKDIIIQVANQIPQSEVGFSDVLEQSTGLMDELESDIQPTLSNGANGKTHHHISFKHMLENMPEWDFTVKKARKELGNWERLLKAGKANFKPEFSRGLPSDIIYDALENKTDISQAFDKAQALLVLDREETITRAFTKFVQAIQSGNISDAIKQLQSIRIDFEDDFEDVLNSIRDGSITNRRRAGNILRQLIRTFGARAFRQGLEDGGVMDAPNEEEQAQIAAIRKRQSQFVSNITKVLIKEDGVSDTQAAGKPAMWFKKTILPFYTAGFVSARGNQMMEFTGSDGEESCATCKRLKGQRHRAKAWDRRELWPQRDTERFVCGGFKCEHFLTPVVGRAKGNF
jgi:phage portal protein BeeE